MDVGTGGYAESIDYLNLGLAGWAGRGLDCSGPSRFHNSSTARARVIFWLCCRRSKRSLQPKTSWRKSPSRTDRRLFISMRHSAAVGWKIPVTVLRSPKDRRVLRQELMPGTFLRNKCLRVQSARCTSASARLWFCLAAIVTVERATGSATRGGMAFFVEMPVSIIYERTASTMQNDSKSPAAWNRCCCPGR